MIGPVVAPVFIDCFFFVFVFVLAAHTAAPAERHLSSKADAAFATDLRGVYEGNREQQRHIVLGQLQWRCDVRQTTGIGFQQKCGQRFRLHVDLLQLRLQIGQALQRVKELISMHRIW